MLKFASWPPEVNEVDWTLGAQESLYEMNVHGEPSSKCYDELTTIGRFVGTLLAANVEHATDTELHFKVPRIAVELTQGWSCKARQRFMVTVEDATHQPSGIMGAKS